VSSRKQLSRRSFFGHSAAAGAAAAVCLSPLRWLTQRVEEPSEDSKPQSDEPLDQWQSQLADRRQVALQDLSDQLEDTLWGEAAVSNNNAYTVAANTVEVQPGKRYGPFSQQDIADLWREHALRMLLKAEWFATPVTDCRSLLKCVV